MRDSTLFSMLVIILSISAACGPDHSSNLSSYASQLTRSQRNSHVKRVWWSKSDIVFRRVCDLGEPFNPDDCSGDIEQIRLESLLAGFGVQEDPQIELDRIDREISSLSVSSLALEQKDKILSKGVLSDDTFQHTLQETINKNKLKIERLSNRYKFLKDRPFFRYLSLLRDEKTHLVDQSPAAPGSAYQGLENYIGKANHVFQKYLLSEGGRCAQNADERYQDNPEYGGCFDAVNRLAWSKPATGLSSIEVGKWSRLGAQAYCKSLNQGGKTDWSLPSVENFKTLDSGAIGLGSSLYWTTYQVAEPGSASAKDETKNFPIGTYEVLTDSGWGFFDVEETQRLGTIHRSLDVRYIRTENTLFDAGRDAFVTIQSHAFLSAVETRTPVPNDEGPRRTPGPEGLRVDTGPRRIVGPTLGVETQSNVSWGQTILPSNTMPQEIGVVCVREIGY